MFDDVKFFLKYRKQNKIISKALKIRRDRKVELYLLFGFWRREKAENILKRNCRCYLAYYEKRNIKPTFKNLDYIISRFISIYNILGDKDILQIEIENFDDNYFCKTYIENKVKELLNINDAEMKNLVKEAVN